MKISRTIIGCAAAASLVVCGVGKASAGSVSLASFAQSVPGIPFHYDTGVVGVGDGSISNVPAKGIGVTFNGLSAGLPSDGTAFLTIATTTSDRAGLIPVDDASGGGPGTKYVQDMDSVTIDIWKDPVGTIGNKLLLEMKATQALIHAQANEFAGTDTSAGLQGNTTGLGLNTKIEYHSDFASDAVLNSGPYRDYSLSFTSLSDTPLAESIASGVNDFQSFNMSGSGVFGYTPTVPEPGSVALLVGAGISGSLFGLRLRRR